MILQFAFTAPTVSAFFLGVLSILAIIGFAWVNRRAVKDPNLYGLLPIIGLPICLFWIALFREAFGS